MYAFDAAGKFQRPLISDSLIPRLDRGIEPVDLRKIQAPTLAIYAVPGAAETMYPCWASLDSAGQGRARTSHAALSALLGRLRAHFQRDVPHARGVVIPGARH